MTRTRLTHLLPLLPPTLLLAAATAQNQDLLVTFRYQEQTMSGSGGTVLQTLRPNEIVHIDRSQPCPGASAEKFSPRTCFHTMAGDENGDGQYWNPAIFGQIDALAAPISATPISNGVNPRSVFWSPSVAMGTNISGLPLRPGDVGRIINVPGDGQVQYFMRQEQFNQAMGLPLTTPIDIDAIAFHPGMGVYFSLDTDINAFTFCGPTLIRDGDVVCVPDWAITWTPDFRVASVLPVSAVVVHTEAQMDAFVLASGVTDKFGVCLTNAVDVEGLEIDWQGSVSTMFPCPGAVVQVPCFIFSTETMTGASLLTTAGGGQIYAGMCGPAGTVCGGGPTWGPQLGIRPASTTQGANSYVNGIAASFVCRYVLEPQQHQLNYGGLGGPGTTVAIGSPWLWNFSYIELVPPTVPGSITVAPALSAFCFPDWYFPSLNFWLPVPAPGGFGTFPTPAIPPFWTGKILFQSIAFGGSGIELSTPTVIDVN
ncbi:MAG TPA: hypothetical protein VFZ65_19670 [Planctomycetota bacterium]|nr:hypothetical protein [Planctomycetota bacterium]